jgi:glutamate/tyrosine decarboxylase-like PLP-dependent enzyme
MAEEARRGIDLAMLGPQFTRGFDALRVWVSLLAHGRAAYARRISHDAALARYLGELVEEHPDFELMTPVSLSICCFRYAPADLRGDDEALDRLNERIMTAIHVDGRTYCSNAVLGGRFCLRACVVNFRTEADDMETLLAVAVEHGERLRG